MPPSRRDDLVNAAVDVFYRHGFHKTNIDQVLEVGGISRMTLYNHFESKEALVVAALRQRDEQFRELMLKGADEAIDRYEGALARAVEARAKGGENGAVGLESVMDCEGGECGADEWVREMSLGRRKGVWRIIGLFDFHCGWFEEEQFSGCMFINASAAYEDAGCEVRGVASEHKRTVVRFLRNQCEEAGLRNPSRLSEQLNILLDGAIVAAQVEGQVSGNEIGMGDSGEWAKRAALVLMREAARD
ncbi:HTH-type transcriptional regulator RutR [Poriferisphaera corsica]|uniref:HTH-type transcriptional regulator RutR n=1 Tax=Poriferisphaera corsica TaxID=2528020 RepID=A0A517YPA3_9BACT|nr:TetR family transcriptional regulator [Poriferisphaera corsica]QDU32051.1 HTH-type transcriptional regulator RutR [Poriferisphaera corsica]